MVAREVIKCPGKRAPDILAAAAIASRCVRRSWPRQCGRCDGIMPSASDCCRFNGTRLCQGLIAHRFHRNGYIASSWEKLAGVILSATMRDTLYEAPKGFPDQ